MARVVLSADYTLMSNYWDLPLSTFFSCIPSDFASSRFAFRLIAPTPLHDGGVARFAPYGLRKFEAALLSGPDAFSPEEVVVAHPRHVQRFIGPETEAVGLYAMDPLGMGPVSMTFTNGGEFTAHTKSEFYKLVRAANGTNGHRKNYKVVVGGPGGWQLEHRPLVLDELGIDHVVTGECDTTAPKILRDLSAKGGDRFVKVRGFPSVEEMPDIRKPAMHGMVEVMRGCGRNCDFCDVNLRRARDYPLDKVKRELAVNVAGGHNQAWLHSDDVFLYGCQNRANLEPNVDAICALFQTAMDMPGIVHVQPTHGTLAPNVSNPELTVRLRGITRAGPRNWTGIQSGVETGSAELMRKYMPRKALPLSVDSWQDIIVQAVRHLNDNYWYPAMTVIVGLPGETPEDSWETVRLLFRLERELENPHFIMAPLCFVPVGVLKNENFYRVDANLDEARYNVIYHCWRHTVREMDESLWQVSGMPLPIRMVLNVLGRAGGRWILSGLESYARDRGFRLRRPEDLGVNKVRGGQPMLSIG